MTQKILCDYVDFSVLSSRKEKVVLQRLPYLELQISGKRTLWVFCTGFLKLKCIPSVVPAVTLDGT